MKTYSQLILCTSLKDRFEYLSQGAKPTDPTFGSERYLNQQFYRSAEWRQAKRHAIIRDNGCELAHPDYPIQGRIYVHHIEPITLEDILNSSSKLFDLENLVCCSFPMHQALHYGERSFVDKYEYSERAEHDTAPWRQGGENEV